MEGMGAGSAVSDIFGAIGDFAEAAGYRKSAALAEQNVDITKQSTAIQVMQANRQAFQTIGGQISDVGGHGLAETGGALDLLRSSQQQAAMQKQLIQNQGLINEHGYQEQAAADSAMASSQQAAGIGGMIGGALSIGAMVFSDYRLKTDIQFIGMFGKHKLYSYRYKWDDVMTIGVMAQEVLKVQPEAVFRHHTGYLMVDYGRLI